MKKDTDYGLYSILASLIGLVLGFRLVGGILGIYFANEAQKNEQDMSLANAGKIVGIIDIVLAVLIILFITIFMAIWGVAVLC